jgi:Mg-chelatase subunit ChlD
MLTWKRLCCGLLISYGALCAPSLAEEPDPPPPEEQKEKATAPKVDVVFVLDTTGSMGGLLEGAKRKIWSIANEIARGKPTPDIRIGLVAYRDKGDAYVTKKTDLTDDLDGIYKELKGFQAGGGGDTPEHVNAALKEAIEGMSWSAEKGALRVIFLVGDAPPHEDYGDAFDHASLAKQAIEKDIIVNAIRCGGNAKTGEVWEAIAKKAEGTFVTIDQDGGVAAAVKTPFDAELAELGERLGRTRVAFGGEKARRKLEAKEKDAEDALAAAPEDAKADRAAAMSKGLAAGGGYLEIDLISAIEAGEKKLSDLKDEELPDEMKTMTPEERQAYVDGKLKERDDIRKRIAELDEKRDAHLKAEAEKAGGKDGFDKAVRKAIQEQAKKKGIAFEE